MMTIKLVMWRDINTISIVDSLAKVRLVLLDFGKAFDLIGHHILVENLHSLELPSSVINWPRDFLTNRQQRVKLARDCFLA